MDTKKVVGAVVGLAVSVAVIYTIVYFSSKAWAKGKA